MIFLNDFDEKTVQNVKKKDVNEMCFINAKYFKLSFAEYPACF